MSPELQEAIQLWRTKDLPIILDPSQPMPFIPAYKPRQREAKEAWTTHDIAELKQLYASGAPGVQIAAKLDRSQKAIYQQAQRLGLVHGSRG